MEMNSTNITKDSFTLMQIKYLEYGFDKNNYDIFFKTYKTVFSAKTANVKTEKSHFRP